MADEPAAKLSPPSVRISPDNQTVLDNLGLLGELAGNWHGEGFNLIGRPDFQGNANVFVELNLTQETLTFTPISSSIPNRGTFVDDTELFGLTYLQKISDATTGGALHIEPGIWITQLPTANPPIEAPPAGGQFVARMGSIPHGNALLAEGTAVTFEGTPVISPGAQPISGGSPAFSSFPSFNSTPFTPPFPASPLFAAGTSEAQSKPGGGFTEYTLINDATAANPRTPLGNIPPVLDPRITQILLNDPVTLLQQKIQEQIADGYQFAGTAINIASILTAETPLQFFTAPFIAGNPAPPLASVNVPQFGGGVENLPFLQTNADTALVYATFWIERVTHPDRPAFMQLQYAQMVLLNFPAILIKVPPAVQPPASDQGLLNFSWPHITVATLRKTFG